MMNLQLIKKTALAAALSAVAVAASAMTPMQDESLAQVSGQDGVSIAADLDVKMREFRYTNTSANGGSISFNNFNAKGVLAVAIDVVNSATFVADFVAPNSISAPASFYGGGDVVKISLPATIDIDPTKLLNVSVGSITMGGHAAGATAPSFGSFAMNGIDIRGTTAYIWAH